MSGLNGWMSNCDRASIIVVDAEMAEEVCALYQEDLREDFSCFRLSLRCFFDPGTTLENEEKRILH